MKIEIETRIVPVGKIEVRAEADKPLLMVGYAAKFDSPSEDLGGFTEIVKAGCFARALREAQDVRCLFNHRDDMVLGRTKPGTLRLKEDRTGLAIECDLPDTSYSHDLQACLKRGDIDQMSFSFRCHTDDWHMVDGKDVRELIDVDLYDVSPVTFPAYSATTVSLQRNLDVALRGLERFRRSRTDPDAMRRARVFLAQNCGMM